MLGDVTFTFTPPFYMLRAIHILLPSGIGEVSAVQTMEEGEIHHQSLSPYKISHYYKVCDSESKSKVRQTDSRKLF